jgi:hypothetical protein
MHVLKPTFNIRVKDFIFYFYSQEQDKNLTPFIIIIVVEFLAITIARKWNKNHPGYK